MKGLGRGKRKGLRKMVGGMEKCTVSWRLKIFNCIPHKAQLFFSIQLHPQFNFLNRILIKFQLKSCMSKIQLLYIQNTKSTAYNI